MGGSRRLHLGACTRKSGTAHELARLAIALPVEVCHHPWMANDENQDKPESKFAEVIRKGREKRAGMEPQSRDRGEMTRAFDILKDSADKPPAEN